jgi:ribosome maturation factor RimP
MNLESEIAKIVEANGAFLYDTQIVKESTTTIFRVLVTKKGGVDLDLCSSISYELSPFLDVYPPLSLAYTLEVSSPGIERKLSKPIHFQNAVGERVKLRIRDGEKVKGVLKSADETTIIVETKDGDVEYNYDELNSCKTYFDWN